MKLAALSILTCILAWFIFFPSDNFSRLDIKFETEVEGISVGDTFNVRLVFTSTENTKIRLYEDDSNVLLNLRLGSVRLENEVKKGAKKGTRINTYRFNGVKEFRFTVYTRLLNESVVIEIPELSYKTGFRKSILRYSNSISFSGLCRPIRASMLESYEDYIQPIEIRIKPLLDSMEYSE